MKWLLALFLVMWMVPSELPAGLAVTKDASSAATWKTFNEKVSDKVAEIKSVAFGPIVQIFGALAMVYGIAMLFFGQYKPLITWGGIGLLLNIIPHFVDSVFGALLP